jgi:hypothetical protein
MLYQDYPPFPSPLIHSNLLEGRSRRVSDLTM